MPFIVTELERGMQFTISACLAAIMFFAIGAMKSRVFSRPVFRSGVSTLLTGGAAATLAFLVGKLLRDIFGIALA